MKANQISPRSQVKKILIITLSNIGDAILTLPAVDILKRDLPDAHFTILVGEKAAGLFSDDPAVKVVVYHKQSSIKEKIKLTACLRSEKFDLLVDFRNTAFPWLLRSRLRTSPFLKLPVGIPSKREQHLFRLKSVHNFTQTAPPLSIFTTQDDRDYIKDALGDVATLQKLVVISPGAANEWKRWNKSGFARVADQLIEEFGVKLVMVGDENDRPIAQEIINLMRNRPLDLSGKTSLKQLAVLLKMADLLISCDSAVMHMASYFNTPVIALFGPTDPKKYGPWSRKSFVINKSAGCAPCEKSGCRQSHECMDLIRAEDVLEVVRKNFSELKVKTESKKAQPEGKKILIVRTDRIGDVVLTSPVIKALRENCPDNFISIMVSPATREIVEGNPYLDEVIIYDKNQGPLAFMKAVCNLRKRKFDLALILHTKNRTNLMCFLAGIKQRVGYYNNKMGFLLSKKIPDVRAEGKKHEAQYCLDALKAIGIEAQDCTLFMPLKETCEQWADGILKEYGIEKRDKLIAINPGASCPSKIWPAQRFAILADKLIEKYSAKIAIISGPPDVHLAQEVKSKMHHSAIDLAGKTSLSQLVSFLKRCNLFISNDSGPVHIACAVGTPVVAIFGRNESGLSPKRWGPLGAKTAILHKEVGCIECLAHNCQKGFACLEAITEDEMLQAADKLLRS